MPKGCSEKGWYRGKTFAPYFEIRSEGFLLFMTHNCLKIKFIKYDVFFNLKGVF